MNEFPPELFFYEKESNLHNNFQDTTQEALYEHVKYLIGSSTVKIPFHRKKSSSKSFLKWKINHFFFRINLKENCFEMIQKAFNCVAASNCCIAPSVASLNRNFDKFKIKKHHFKLLCGFYWYF